MVLSEGSEEEKLYVTISGKDKFLAGDIEANTNVFKIMNPDLYICTLEPNVTLEIEFTVTKGRGMFLRMIICQRMQQLE